MSDDVLVIGGGIEGYMAALGALETDQSASVRLLSRQDGRFDTETGLIDLLGYRPDGWGPVGNPLAAIDSLPESHRYSQLGVDTVKEALSVFDDVTGDRYVGAETEANALFPTAVGRLAPATRYPRSVEAGVVSEGQAMRLIGFERVVDFHAELAATRLGETTPYDVTATTIQTPLAANDSAIVPELARQLDTNQLTEGRPARASLAKSLSPELDVEPRIGLPAVLGESDTAEIMETLADRLHASVFEIPLGPPSLPGRRLESLLSSELTARGGSLEQAVTVTGIEWEDGRIEGLSGTQGGDAETYEADSYVLATGGVGDGGLRGGPTGVTEPIFDCPVSVPGDGLVKDRFLGNHPAVRAGIEVDDGLHPTSSDGSALYSNLRAAGRVLESTNIIADHAASGFSVVTGYEAGRLAVE